MSKAQTSGFTLVELLVSISIFMFITTLAVTNNSNFNSSILLTNLAYEIGLSIRQAQVFGITVKQSTSDSTKFDSGYGIHFNLTDSPSSYALFEDVKPTGGSIDHAYTLADNIIETFKIQKGNRISKICVTGNCTTSDNFINTVDISFIRPNPDAYITDGGATLFSFAQIYVSSPIGTCRKIRVENTGQISVISDAGSAGACN